jgi:hypothetical protein
VDFIHQQLVENRYILPTDLKLVRLVYCVDEAVEQINQFYSNFHSSRWLKRQFVIRMNHTLSDPALNTCRWLCRPVPERPVPSTCLQRRRTRRSAVQPLARLAFAFNARDHGRLRELVDYINLPENWAQPQPQAQQHTREPSKVT